MHEATTQLLSRLDKLSPFGMGNPKPAFVLRNVVLSQVAWFGKSGEHLRLRLNAGDLSDEFVPVNARIVRSGSSASGAVEAISFYAKRELGAVCEKLEQGSTASLLATLERDQFSRGQPVRLRILGIR